MIEYLIAILIILGTLAYFKLYYQPQKALKHYKNVIEALGYKVKLCPFQFLGCPAFSNFQENEKKYGDALHTYKTEYPAQKYDVLLYNTLATPTIEFFNPELIKSFYQPDNVYVHHKMKFMIQNIQRSVGYGIAFSEDKEWKRKRTIMNAVFNYDFIIENISKIVRIAEEGFNKIEEQCKAKGKFQKADNKEIFKFNPCELFAGIFSNVMLQCFFGSFSTHEKINDQSIAVFINSLNTDINKQTFELPVLIFGTKFVSLGIREKDRDINRRIKLLRELAKDLIEKRLAELEKSGPREKYQDIIEALLLKKGFDKNSSIESKVKTIKGQADKYDYKELIEEFCTFFTAGTDTTSHFAQMMVFYISQNKQIQQKLRKQIDEVIKSDADINKENLKKLTYIDWIQSETTRHYGPGNGIFTRIAQKDHFIGTIPIMKGTGLSIQPITNHFSQKYYKNPQQFKPQRWQSQCDGNHPFALGGFSGGPRTCIGKHLAYLQSKIALVKFMKRYKQLKMPKDKITMQARFLYQAEYLQLSVSK